MSTLNPLPDTFATTREGLHALAEHVISPLRYLEERHIGLQPTAYGFGTDVMHGKRQIRVINGMLSDWTVDAERREEITTLANAAAFLQVTIDADHGLYDLVTDGDPHRPLQVDRPAATVLGEWYTYGATVLQQVRASAGPADKPTVSQLWPEHFDLAMEIGPEGHRCALGASPGDADHAEPYLYVQPWGDRPSGDLWNEKWGASLSYAQLRAGTDGVAWMTKAFGEARA